MPEYKFPDELENSNDSTDNEVEVEYQSDTIGKYGLDFEEGRLNLLSTQTACLASDQCGIPARSKTAAVVNQCTPGSGCC